MKINSVFAGKSPWLTQTHNIIQIFSNVSDSGDLGPMSPLKPFRAQMEYDQASAHLVPNGVHMVFESRQLPQYFPRYMPEKLNPSGPYILRSMGLTAHILPTSKSSSTNKVSFEISENVFAKIAKPAFWLILALYGVKRSPHIWPHVPIF